MPVYRIFPVDEAHVLGEAQEVNQPDNTAALPAALDVASEEVGVEAWDGKHLVVTLPPLPRKQPPD